MNKSLESFLYTEALCHVEEEQGQPYRDQEIEKHAVSAGITFSERITARAEKLVPQLGLKSDLEKTTGRMYLVISILAFCCFIIGMGVTRVLPEGYPAQANVVSLLAVLLLPNAVSLILWLVISTSYLFWNRLDRSNGWLGRRALGIYTFIENVLVPARHTGACISAWRDFIIKTSAGRHRLTLVSHWFWCAAIFGALLGCWWLMVVRQVDFVWGSTLMTAEQVQLLLGKLTGLVNTAGFSVPSNEEIIASRIGEQLYNDELRRRWGIFILGAVFTLGLIPRFIAAVTDTVAYLCFLKRVKPDLAKPGYVRLQPVLMPISSSHTILDPDDERTESPGATAGTSTGFTGIPLDAAWLALEHKPEHPLADFEIRADLGIVSSFEEQQTVLGRLSANSPGWKEVCLYIDISITPDRGVARFLNRLKDSSRQPLHMVLAVTSRARKLDAGDLKIRRNDWIQLAGRAGFSNDELHLIE